METGDLDGKLALVTGASRGIGRAIAEELAQHGARVALNYNSSGDQAARLKSSIKGSDIFKADMARRDEVSEMFSQIHQKMGRVDILVNNAGVMDLMDFENFDEKRVRRMFDVNVMGYVYAALEADIDMRSTGKGIMVNIASNAGIGTAAQGTTYYAMSKAAVIMLTKRLAFELGHSGIRVNAIAPGWVESDMTLSGKSEEITEKLRKNFSQKSSMGMTGKPEFIAKAAYFLCSDNSRYMNGQVMVVDGGRMDNLTHSL